MSAQIDVIFTVKPSGISTHRADHHRQGFVEWLSQKNAIDLKVCHRLDKETSGALVFAKNKETAALLTELFSQQKVAKEYLLISKRASKFKNFLVTSKKGKGTLVEECPLNRGAKGHQTQTEFIWLQSVGPFHLYKAKPYSGKTHQIRRHASQSGIPILGDEEYGGEPFCRLMLHSHKLEFQLQGQDFAFEAPVSPIFTSEELLQDTQLAGWIHSWERRQILFPQLMEKDQALRIIHNESPDLRGDKVGSRWVMGWWSEVPPSKSEQHKIKRFFEILEQKDWVFEWRPGAQDRNSTLTLLTGRDFSNEAWIFKEKECQYQARLDQGQNFGLFLDQRERRAWVKDNSEDKKVLNLFAFTGGFSLNAARGGATQVVTVDLFKKYLEWGRENFLLNDLNPENDRYEWRCMDSLDYLNYAKRKKLMFDIIICDPPSFSRHKKAKSVFRVDKDYKNLLELCRNVLLPGGTLLFSTNYEKWNLQKWQECLQDVAKSVGFDNVEWDSSQWDYEWQALEANLKAFRLS